MIASRPTREQAGPPPPRLLDLAGGRRITPVWRNEIHGVTWQIGEGAHREFVKIGPVHPECDPASDAARLNWLRGRVNVPEVLGHGTDGSTAWLHTHGLPGRSAADRCWSAEPAEVVRALGEALRRFHDSLDVQGCPYTWSVRDRLGGLQPEAPVLVVPEVDAVVCHGDACTPNTLLDRDGQGRLRASGYVDVGACGVADRWADLAPALMSLAWNLPGPPDGGDWTELFLQSYGTARDERRLQFYTWLWNVE